MMAIGHVKSNAPPTLTPEGQKLFWDKQGETYKFAEITNDNDEELNIVQRLCEDHVSSGYSVEDVVTLGGAVGSRDPGVVLEPMLRFGKQPKNIIFNDLSEVLLQRAYDGPLFRYRSLGISTKLVPGSILGVAKEIKHAPRRIFLGMFRAEALVSVGTEEGAQDGLAAYIRNKSLVGERLFLEWQYFKNGAYVPAGNCLIIESADTFSGEAARSLIHADIVSGNAHAYSALRVIGVCDGKEGFFLSHWFTESGAKEILHSAFGARTDVAQFIPCKKGWVVCMDPLNKKPEGILTCLNNVIGNILPNEHVPALSLINKISA